MSDKIRFRVLFFLFFCTFLFFSFLFASFLFSILFYYYFSTFFFSFFSFYFILFYFNPCSLLFVCVNLCFLSTLLYFALLYFTLGKETAAEEVRHLEILRAALSEAEATHRCAENKGGGRDESSRTEET